MSLFVVVVGLFGMLTALLTSLNERRREMAILRSVGARPRHVIGLLVAEAGLLACVGALLGLVLLYGALALLQPLIETRFGLFVPLEVPGVREFGLLAMVSGAGLVAVVSLIGRQASAFNGLSRRSHRVPSAP